MDSNKNDRASWFVFNNSQIYNNIAVIYLYQCFLNFSSSCRWQYNRKWVSVFLVGISFSWYDWQGSWIFYFLSITVYVFSGKPTEFAYNSKNIWYNLQKIYSKRHKFSEGTFTVGFVSTKPLKWRKQFFVMETILKSVAFHLLPFQLEIPNFLSYSVKRWRGRKRKDPGDQFWCGIPETKQAWRNTNACFGNS